MSYDNVCLPLKSTSSIEITNRSGRPKMKNIVKFGPQPMSIVAEMLSKSLPQNNIDQVVEEIVCLDDEPDSSSQLKNSDEQIICSICSHNSNSTKEHKAHLVEHKQFACDFPNCTYICKLSSNLIKHKRVHTNEKPYLCESCCFRSNFVNSLKAHKRTHTAEKPYHCEYCSYKCNSSSNLKKHCRHRHADSYTV